MFLSSSACTLYLMIISILFALELCSGTPMDIYFIGDKSKSIDERQLNAEKKMISNLIERFDIGKIDLTFTQYIH